MSIADVLGELRDLANDLQAKGADDTVYGSCFVDPRNFSPDPECSTEAERELHKADCERLERGEPVTTQTRCYASDLGENRTAIVMPAGYGLGVNVCDGDKECSDMAERLYATLRRLESWIEENESALTENCE